MAEVVIVGSCVQDLISYTEKFPRPGESVRGKKFLTGFGGKGANQAVVASRLGAKTAMVAKVGMDMFGPPTIENFRNEGVNTDFVSLSQTESTATATITVSETGENSIVVILGANMALSARDVTAAEDVITRAKVMCCQLEIQPQVTLAALKLAKQHGVMTIFNPAPGLPDTDPTLLKYSDVVCPNENEAEFLSGEKVEGIESAKSIAMKILELGPHTVIITLGPKGCVFVSKDDPVPDHIPCPKVDAVDTTGAGDAFVGSFAFFSATRSDLSLKERITRASQIASYSVRFPGTQSSYPHRSDLDHSILE